MLHSSFINTIRSYTPFTDAEAIYLLSFFEERKYKRNDVLLQEGNIAHEVFFIVTGALRQYIITEEGIEKTCNFSFEGEFLTDLESFSRQSGSASNIVALEPTTCLSLNCISLVEAIKTSSASSELFRVILEHVATENINRTKSLLMLSPEKQFAELIEKKPEILQRVSQRYIAQYLGIAPESLSRIRKRIMTPQKS